MSLEDKIIAIIATELEKKPEEVSGRMAFKEDLGADSLALYQMMIAMQDEFDIDDYPPEDDFMKIKTVADVIEYLKTLLGSEKVAKLQ